MKTKCKFCNKRYAKQQDWKTGPEKELCLKCHSWHKYVRDIEKDLNNQLKHYIGLKDKELKITISDKDYSDSIKCLLCEHRFKN